MFIGWVRQRRTAWQQVCQADTEAACWAQLLAKRYPAHADKLVLPSGESPDQPARRRGAYGTKQMTPDSP